MNEKKFRQMADAEDDVEGGVAAGGIPYERIELMERACAGISTDDLRMGVVPRRVADSALDIAEAIIRIGEDSLDPCDGSCAATCWRCHELNRINEIRAAYREATQKGAGE
jgi:hypothetical protein